jgi:hypothetical protein
MPKLLIRSCSCCLGLSLVYLCKTHCWRVPLLTNTCHLTHGKFACHEAGLSSDLLQIKDLSMVPVSEPSSKARKGLSGLVEQVQVQLYGAQALHESMVKLLEQLLAEAETISGCPQGKRACWLCQTPAPWYSLDRHLWKAVTLLGAVASLFVSVQYAAYVSWPMHSLVIIKYGFVV